MRGGGAPIAPYSYIIVISRIHYRFHFDGLLYCFADGLPAWCEDQRGDAGVCGRGINQIVCRDLARGTKQRSAPFGVARVACFERLASVFASRVASLPKSPVSQS